MNLTNVLENTLTNYLQRETANKPYLKEYNYFKNQLSEFNYDYFKDNKEIYILLRSIIDLEYMHKIVTDENFRNDEFAEVKKQYLKTAAITKTTEIIGGAVVSSLVTLGIVTIGIGTIIGTAIGFLGSAVNSYVAYDKAGNSADDLGKRIDNIRNNNIPNYAAATKIYSNGLDLLHQRPKYSINPTTNIQYRAKVSFWNDCVEDYIKIYNNLSYDNFVKGYLNIKGLEQSYEIETDIKNITKTQNLVAIPKNVPKANIYMFLIILALSIWIIFIL